MRIAARVLRFEPSRFAGPRYRRRPIWFPFGVLVLGGVLLSCKEKPSRLPQPLPTAGIDAVLPWGDGIALLQDGYVRFADIREGLGARRLGLGTVVAIDPASRSFLSKGHRRLELHHDGGAFILHSRTASGSWSLAGTRKLVTVFRDGRPFLDHSEQGWSRPSEAVLRFSQSISG